jgi:hypothetical protein
VKRNGERGRIGTVSGAAAAASRAATHAATTFFDLPFFSITTTKLGTLEALAQKWMRHIFLELDLDLVFLEPLTRELSIRPVCGRRGKHDLCWRRLWSGCGEGASLLPVEDCGLGKLEREFGLDGLDRLRMRWVAWA